MERKIISCLYSSSVSSCLVTLRVTAVFVASGCNESRSQWPCRLKHRSAAARLLGLWVRIPQEVWKFVCCECCVLSGRGLCYELITRPEEYYRLCCVAVCDLEPRSPWPAGGCHVKLKKKRNENKGN
jgi:hypothetical protein